VVLRDTLEMEARPQAVFDIFDGMDQARCLSWHRDPKRFVWTRRQGSQASNRFYFEDAIAGTLPKKHVVLTSTDGGRHIESAPTFWLMRLLLSRRVFGLEVAAGCRHRQRPKPARADRRAQVFDRCGETVEPWPLRRTDVADEPIPQPIRGQQQSDLRENPIVVASAGPSGPLEGLD
jgi:hypothetical protein